MQMLVLYNGQMGSATEEKYFFSAPQWHNQSHTDIQVSFILPDWAF